MNRQYVVDEQTLRSLNLLSFDYETKQALIGKGLDYAPLKEVTTVYLVYSNDFYEGDCECDALHRTLEAIYLDRAKAEEHYKRLFKGFMDTETITV